MLIGRGGKKFNAGAKSATGGSFVCLTFKKPAWRTGSILNEKGDSET
jgi:hypothetical protein